MVLGAYSFLLGAYSFALRGELLLPISLLSCKRLLEKSYLSESYLVASVLPKVAEMESKIRSELRVETFGINAIRNPRFVSHKVGSVVHQRFWKTATARQN